MGIGIRQYTEKPRGTLCARIVYGVGSLQHIAPWPATKRREGWNVKTIFMIGSILHGELLLEYRSVENVEK